MDNRLSLGEKPEKRFFGCNANMWIYALGVMGINFGIGLVNSYQAEFFNKIMNANLIAIAVIILIAKFISVVADFIIGNLIDRFRLGYVIDYIDVLFVKFYVFNFADCLVTVGAFLIIGYQIYEIIKDTKEKKEKQNG